MYRLAEQRLARLLNSGAQAPLRDARIGLEKEGLRVNTDGGIAQTPHPAALGAALTNPYITTDYSEALLELITPPFTDLRESLNFLRDVHKFVYDRLDDEILWTTSMPCVLAGESSIPIAQYGTSNIGMMKTVYRRGLGYRYGRVMQVIAGVHFNYSLPESFWPFYQGLEQDSRPLQDFISDSYFAMIRNLQRFGWLIPYLFGASPAVCKSFMGGEPADLAEFDASTYYEPFGTSLRMGDIGYQNRKEDETGVKICYDNLDCYASSLTHAISTPCSVYEKIGVAVNGEYRQLNSNLLQIENEYYSTIRPKQVLQNNEKPTLALQRRGVRYVELRSLDVNAFAPLGISEEQLYFLEAFLVFCLLHESPKVPPEEREAIDWNQSAAAHRGRDAKLALRRNGGTQRLRDWAVEMCDAMQGVCELLDQGHDQRPYSAAVANQREVALDPDRTPSARMLAEMRETREGFYHFARRMSQQHRHYFDSLTLDEERLRLFNEKAQRSMEEQKQIEGSDTLSFEDYLRQYFAQA